MSNTPFPLILRSPILMALGVALLIVAIRGSHKQLWDSFIGILQDSPSSTSPSKGSPVTFDKEVEQEGRNQ